MVTSSTKPEGATSMIPSPSRYQPSEIDSSNASQDATTLLNRGTDIVKPTYIIDYIKQRISKEKKQKEESSKSLKVKKTEHFGVT